MSGSMDECRAHVAHMRHDMGECEEWCCPWCEDEQLEDVDNCELCSEPIYRGDVCRGCWDKSHD